MVPHVDDKRIKEMFIEVLNQIITSKKTIIKDFELMKDTFKPIDSNELALILDEIKKTDELIDRHTLKASASSISSNEYMAEYETPVKRHNILEEKYNELIKENEKRRAKLVSISSFIETIKKTDNLPLEFSESLFNQLIDRCTVTKDGNAIFKLRNGKEITLAI